PPPPSSTLFPYTTLFRSLTKNFPQSPLFGKAQLHLGWCYWLEENMGQAQKAFQGAVERLPVSPEQALAYFKLGDTQFRQNDFTKDRKSTRLNSSHVAISY